MKAEAMARKLVLTYWMLHKPWESEVCTEDFPNAYLTEFEPEIQAYFPEKLN